ncbi:MAG: hypothetical protein A2X86_09635 [Bdellovibrionales bacterium GWA2_49_15]|nr:MAG: hypothetical protein A2X86_09635 [Bdellovibrionales bacterium GWA2_49_15]
MQLKSGERLAIIGGNGSGKTTLLKLILGFLPPGNGVIAKSPNLQLSYANIERSGHYPTLTGLENLFLWRALTNISKAQFASAMAEWQECALFKKTLTQRANSFSTGMSSILALFKALNFFSSDQRLACLDEPWAHLDQSAQTFIASKIKANPQHSSMIITCHQLSDNIHTVCSRTLQIEGGKLVPCH